MSEFDNLLADLDKLDAGQDQMAKALKAADGLDERNIQAAAATPQPPQLAKFAAQKGKKNKPTPVKPEPASQAAQDDAYDDEEEEGDEDEQDLNMLKSFSITMPDGTQSQAIDGTAMVLDLQNRLLASEQNTNAVFAKALGVLTKQSALLQTMGEKIAELGGQGRGRRAVLSITEKSEPGSGMFQKSMAAPVGLSTGEFFAKALSAQKAGRISGLDISVAEASLNRGEPVPEDILNRVMSVG